MTNSPGSSHVLEDDDQTLPLHVSVEALANLIYLARHSEVHPEQQRQYLAWAETVIAKMSKHPKLYE